MICPYCLREPKAKTERNMSNATVGYAQDFLISNSIETTVNGVEVEGYSEASFHNIKTTITKPFKNLHECWHIPYFAQGHMSYHGKLGGCRGQESLKELYWLADYVHRKGGLLKRGYQEFEERRKEVSDEKSIWKLEDKFFEKHFPMLVFGSMRESVIQILEGKKFLV